MTSLHPFMRLKVKGDTFFLPDPNGGVYFRNNLGSFKLEGRGIDRWIEKLMPVFNGQNSLEDLAEGLPDEYRDRIYEIAEVLIQNGMVRDVSQDHPHELPAWILEKYTAQIALLDNLAGSGAYRFQVYRQAKVAAMGSGPILVSLVQALLTSGLPKLHLLAAGTAPTNWERISQLAAHASFTDTEVAIEEVILPQGSGDPWREALQPFDFILYVSEHGDLEELRRIHAICREEQKVLLPAVGLQQAGVAGPMIHPDAETCLESAWRRIHRAAIDNDKQLHKFSSTAGALLANVIVFELLKTVTKVSDSLLQNQCFLLNLETLEGNWHSVLPHPLVTRGAAGEWVSDLQQLHEASTGKSDSNGLMAVFNSLTSPVSGILHLWEEGDLPQLPLAQCCVQAADPLGQGPAELLPQIVCTGLTHDEARREAGLAGLEMYLSRLANELPIESTGPVGVGVGQTEAEAVCRGLQNYLEIELKKQFHAQVQRVFSLDSCDIEDERCQFYLRALTTLQKDPLIAAGDRVFGFPVMLVRSNSCWHASVGLNETMALRKALQKALLQAQNPTSSLNTQEVKIAAVHFDKNSLPELKIPSYEEFTQWEDLQSAIQVLKQNRKRLWVSDLAVEPFLKKELAGAFAVLLREEDLK